jgi:DNA-directed RNA polymerase II subunit RPB2
VLRAKNTDGTRMVRVRVRKTRTPIVGDKFSSRMGQKGVIGITLPQEDMPYTADGMVPDIIVNPHAIPSRMTIGQLAEELLAILCTLRGERGDGTMFRGGSLEQLSEELQKLGYDRYGRVELHNGFTGEAFPAKVFMGPTFYQRLRHMAADKDHARARGPIHMLSRQPTEGRARDGGLRFGEMERDTIIAHGAAEFLRDRLLDNSDPSELTLCGTCGLLAQPQAAGTHVRHKKPSCRNCGNEAKVFQMGAPFAFRLLMQELQAMSIAVRFEF